MPALATQRTSCWVDVLVRRRLLRRHVRRRAQRAATSSEISSRRPSRCPPASTSRSPRRCRCSSAPCPSSPSATTPASRSSPGPGTFDFLRYGEDVGTLTQQPDGNYVVDPDGPGPAAQFNIVNRDFSYRSLLGNAVLRWEWRQGSTLFLVWQQRRISSLANLGPSGADTWIGDFDLGRDVGDMFATPADNILAIKVNYWLNP